MEEFKKKYININVSDIAACINKNPYVPRDVMILKIWEIYDVESFNKAIERNNMKIIRLKEIDKNNITVDNDIKQHLLNYENFQKNIKNSKIDRFNVVNSIKNY